MAMKREDVPERPRLQIRFTKGSWLIHRFVVALLISAYAHVAFAQGGCSGQWKPSKPLRPVGCQEMVPACICDRQWNCRWEWACSASGRRGSENRVDIDATIPLMGRPPQFNSPLDSLLRVEQLRQQQLESMRLQQEMKLRELEAETQKLEAETQKMEQENDALMRAHVAAWAARNAKAEDSPSKPPGSAPEQGIPATGASGRQSDALTRLPEEVPAAAPGRRTARDGFPCFITNGHVWNILPPIAKVLHLAGFAEAFATAGASEGRFPERWKDDGMIPQLDQFYTDPANIRIPTVWAVRLIAMKRSGGNESAIEKERSFMQGVVSTCPPLR